MSTRRDAKRIARDRDSGNPERGGGVALATLSTRASEREGMRASGSMKEISSLSRCRHRTVDAAPSARGGDDERAPSHRVT